MGDAAMYKAVALTAAPFPQALRAVAALTEPLPDFPRLLKSTVPLGSVGAAFAKFVADNGITPLSVSQRVREEVAPLNLVAARYVLVHDMFHVLLGFDISRPGELAVWSFVAEQRYSPSYARAAALARLLYPIAQPSALSALALHRRQAVQLAKVCPCLIGRPLEQYWSLPLQEVRRELGIRKGNDA